MFLKLSSTEEISACQQELFSCPFGWVALQLSIYLSSVVCLDVGIYGPKMHVETACINGMC
jgi:hypothetical protein